MDEQDGFIFHDSDYLQESFSAFQDMRIKMEHTDVAIKTSNRFFPAHRVILSARIPHFRKILSTQDKNVLMNEIDPDVLDSIINFAYEGKLRITLASLQPMLFAAVYLGLDQVQRACLEFQTKRFQSKTEVRAIKLIPSDDNIRSNFDKFSKSAAYLLLPYCYLKALISRDDLIVTREENVFEAVMNWVKGSPVERRHRLPYLLPEIRFNYLSPEFLVEKVANEVFVKTSDQCRQIVEEAKNYHLLKKRPESLSFKTAPRIYADKHEKISRELTTSVVAIEHCNVSYNDTVASASISCNMPEDTPRISADSRANISCDLNTGVVATENCNVSYNSSAESAGVSCHMPEDTPRINADTHENISRDLNRDVMATERCSLSHNHRDNMVASASFSYNTLKHALRISADTHGNVSRDLNTAVMAPDHSNVKNNNSDNTVANTSVSCSMPRGIPRIKADTREKISRDLNTSTVLGHCNVSHNSSDNVVPSVSCSTPQSNVSENFRNGIYAVRSFSAIGTTVSYYNTLSRKWDYFLSISSSECPLQVVSVAEKIYVFFLKSLEMFNLIALEWCTVGQLPITVEGSGIVSNDNKIYIFGGRQLPEVVRCFDGEQNQWLQDEVMSMPLHSMSAVSSPEADIFLSGGYNTSCSNQVIKFHPASKKWTDMPSMICNRMDHASAVFNRKLYVCGGRNNEEEFLQTVEAYDQESKQWAFVSYLSAPRYAHSLVAWDRKLYVFGGVTEKELCSFDVEVYDPQFLKNLFSFGEWMFGDTECPDDDIAVSLLSEETVVLNLRATTVASAR